MLLHELKKKINYDSTGHLKTLCMSILLLSYGVESEWKCCSSQLEKMLAFEYESTLNQPGSAATNLSVGCLAYQSGVDPTFELNTYCPPFHKWKNCQKVIELT